MSQLARVYAAQHRYAEALALHHETLALRKAKLGPDHPETVLSMDDVAHCLHALDRHQDALELRAETLPLMRKKLGIDHPETLRFMHRLADSYDIAGKKD